MKRDWRCIRCKGRLEREAWRCNGRGPLCHKCFRAVTIYGEPIRPQIEQALREAKQRQQQ